MTEDGKSLLNGFLALRRLLRAPSEPNIPARPEGPKEMP